MQRAPGCPVIALVGSLTRIVTARSERGARSKSIGSETIGAPVGIVTEVRPPNASGLPPSGLMAPPPADPAT